MNKLIIRYMLAMGFIAMSAVMTIASGVSMEQLTGKWEFVYWAENDDPASKRSINMIMEFKKDGTIVNHVANKKTTASYTINGNVIEYSDKNGTQQWEVISFSPNDSMKVNHKGAVMYFERR